MILEHYGQSSQSGQVIAPAQCSPHDVKDSRESALELPLQQTVTSWGQPCVQGPQGPGTHPRETAQGALNKVRRWGGKGGQEKVGGHILQERDRGKGPEER